MLPRASLPSRLLVSQLLPSFAVSSIGRVEREGTARYVPGAKKWYEGANLKTDQVLEQVASFFFTATAFFFFSPFSCFLLLLLLLNSSSRFFFLLLQNACTGLFGGDAAGRPAQQARRLPVLYARAARRASHPDRCGGRAEYNDQIII